VLLGRVNSLVRLLAWGMMPVGLILSGLIVQLAEGPLARGTALLVPF
jgi:sulfite exporter TauE/SafE